MARVTTNLLMGISTRESLSEEKSTVLGCSLRQNQKRFLKASGEKMNKMEKGF